MAKTNKEFLRELPLTDLLAVTPAEERLLILSEDIGRVVETEIVSLDLPEGEAR